MMHTHKRNEEDKKKRRNKEAQKKFIFNSLLALANDEMYWG